MTAFTYQIESNQTGNAREYAVYKPDGSEYCHGATTDSKKQLAERLKKSCARLNELHGIKKRKRGRSPNFNGSKKTAAQGGQRV